MQLSKTLLKLVNHTKTNPDWQVIHDHDEDEAIFSNIPAKVLCEDTISTSREHLSALYDSLAEKLLKLLEEPEAIHYFADKLTQDEKSLLSAESHYHNYSIYDDLQAHAGETPLSFNQGNLAYIAKNLDWEFLAKYGISNAAILDHLFEHKVPLSTLKYLVSTNRFYNLPVYTRKLRDNQSVQTCIVRREELADFFETLMAYRASDKFTEITSQYRNSDFKL